jgi:hypothetical protein
LNYYRKKLGMFSARIICNCGYDYETKQTSENMAIWAVEKLKKIHQAECDRKLQIVMGKD